ncbi:peptidyl-tRNA hydrolase 2 [Penicillium waksmanii]|uniref:peptidyl-tRNA hydrolase 2 n=1 Tax=Penicillium waksmanii TaxID=69791 RepID=UPI002547E120|nr:peptidyl-tRNA hydrolase 2 [Penicillium waksmanii]KAJ5983593.1 peptidyl-tRNA hydrolase 2 [Penicillium waksmanii]
MAAPVPFDRAPPTTTAYVIATGIIAGLVGYFIGQGASLGLFHEKKNYDVKVHRDSSDEEDEEAEDDSEDEGNGEELAHFKDNAEEVKMVLVIRTDLGMTKGKMAAQASHASLSCYKYSKEHQAESPILSRWERGGQAKIALQIKGEEELLLLQAQAMSLGLCARVIQDAGRTQIAAGSRTVLGILGPKSVVDGVTGHLKLL